MHLLMMAFCEHAELRPDGKLDVHGAFADLAAPGFPAKQDTMVLVVAVEWEPGDGGRYRFKVELKGRGGQPSLTIDGETEVRAFASGDRPARTYLIMPVDDVVFPEPGPYRLEARLKGETLLGPVLHLWEIDEGSS
jgi:hypothetical protein